MKIQSSRCRLSSSILRELNSNIQSFPLCRYLLGHPIILVTDSHENSVVPFSDIVLYTYRGKKEDTIVPVSSLIETITLALGNEVENSNKILDDIGKLLVKSNITTL